MSKRFSKAQRLFFSPAKIPAAMNDIVSILEESTKALSEKTGFEEGAAGESK